MSRLIPGNQKHLTLEDRIFIENSLNEGRSFKEISRYLCKDPSTISREVKNHRLSDWYHKGTFYNAQNFCIHRYHCKMTNACQKIVLCGVKCASCPTCNQTCRDFVLEKCTRLDRAPHVCNGCDKKLSRCTIARKYQYNARFADRKYREVLTGTRTGINITQKELRKIDKVITPLISQGQSPYQIVTNHPELSISAWTMYTNLDNGLFTARNIDLKRKVKFKPRKNRKAQISSREIFKGRTFEDFQALGLENWVEMDTVHSSKGSGKVLLTFLLRKEKLFLAFVMNRNTTGAVRLVFDSSLENGIEGIVRTSIYYCDSMRSCQKPGVENVHTMLRMILPKKTSFEFLTQWDVNLIVNHINSTPRKSLDGKTPYEAARESLGEEVLKKFQLRPIPPDEVNLTPKLIRYNR